MRPILHLTLAALVASAVTFAAPTAAVAQPDYFRDGAHDGELKVRLERSRTTRERLVIASLAAGTVVFGGVGLLFHLDSRSASDEVSAVGSHTGRTYTVELEDTRERAIRSGRFAAAGYAVGGALLVATVVALVVTEPGDDVVVLGHDAASTTLVPVPGGALVGRSWSF